MNLLVPYERMLARSRRLLALGSNLALLAIMAGVSLDTLLRYFANRPVAGMLEGVELLLVFAVFAGLAQTQADGGHIAIEAFTERLRGRSLAFVRALTAALALALFAAMTWATGAYAWRSWQMGEYSAGLIAFPIYPSRFVVAFGCFFLCLQLLQMLLSALRRLFGGALEPQ